MDKTTFFRKYGLTPSAAGAALLLLAVLFLVASAQSAGGQIGMNEDSISANPPSHRPQSVDSPSADGSPASWSQAQAEAAFRSSPVMFIENVGQFDDRARFQVRGGTGTMWLADDGVWITLLERKEIGDWRLEIEEAGNQSLISQATRALPQAPTSGVNLKLTFPGANPHPRTEPFDRLDTKVSYFIGNDPEKWRPDVPVWAGVRYVDLYPGVDLEITSVAGHWTWRLVFHNTQYPISNIQLRVAGADALTLAGPSLRLTTAVGDVTLPLLQAVAHDGTPLDLPATSPEINDTNITSPFSSSASRSSIRLSAAHPLPQDRPADLLYATFLGGGSYDSGNGIAVDRAGRAYVTGRTGSADFPIALGAFDTSTNGGDDAFVARLNAASTALEYATFLGGGDGDFGRGIAVDRAGRAYVTGYTHSADFPATPAAFDTSYNGGGDAFVARLNAAGTALEYATFLGGGDWEGGEAIVVDGGGRAYVTGYTGSTDFPATPAAFDTSYNGGDRDAFAARLNAAGTALEYATFLGGNITDWGGGIAVDRAGRAYVTGYTVSADFPATPAAFDTSYNGGDDAFVARLNAAGTALEYATFLGGGDWDEGRAIVVDGGDRAYVTGDTRSADFPATPNAFDTSYNGGDDDAFVVRLSMAGAVLEYATFLGGGDGDFGRGIAVDRAGRAYVTGYTVSADFPATPAAFDTSYSGGSCSIGSSTYPCPDSFVARLNVAGAALEYATFLGGSGGESGSGIVVDEAGRSFVASYTSSTDFPATPGAFDTFYNGSSDAFVAKLAMGGETDVFVTGVEPIQAVEGAPLIAGKRTGIKVSVGVNGGNGAGNVRIKILHDGPEFSTFYPRVSENLDIGGYLKHSTTRIDIPPGGSPLDVYFFPPSDFWPQSAGTYRITAVVEADGDTDVSNNQLTTERSAISTEWGTNEELHLFFAPVEEQQDYYAADWVSFVERTFPISELNVSVLYSHQVVSLSTQDEVYCRLVWFDNYQLCRKAQYAKKLFHAAKIAAPQRADRAVGIVSRNWLGEGVAGQTVVDPLTGRLIVDAVLLDVDAEPQVLAHELGHTYGLYVNPECEQYDPDCDENTPDILGVPVDGGLDPIFRELKQHALTAGGVHHEVYDFMGTAKYQPPKLDRWVTLDTYQRLITAATRTAGTRSIGSKNNSADVQTVLVLGGMVKADGEVTLDSYYLLPEGKTTELPPDGDVLIQLRGANDQVLYQGGLPSSVRFTDSDSSQLDGVPLAVAVPFPEDTRYVTISLFGEELDRRVVSVNPPTVTVLSPEPGEVVDDQIQVSWQASDPDGDAVTAAVLLNADSGQTWQTIAMDVAGDSYSIDTRSLQAGSSYRVKLIATDGVRTGVAESGPFKILKDVYLPVVARDHSSAGMLYQSSHLGTERRRR